MDTGESVVRILGGAVVGVMFALLLRMAPPALARAMLTGLGLGIILLLLLMALGLGRRGALALALLLGVLAVAGVVSPALAATGWYWVRYAAGLVAAGIQASLGASPVRVLVLWALLGAVLNLMAGSVHLSSLRRSW